MTIEEIRKKYLEETKTSYFNKHQANNYSRFLEELVIHYQKKSRFLDACKDECIDDGSGEGYCFVCGYKVFKSNNKINAL